MNIRSRRTEILLGIESTRLHVNVGKRRDQTTWKHTLNSCRYPQPQKSLGSHDVWKPETSRSLLAIDFLGTSQAFAHITKVRFTAMQKTVLTHENEKLLRDFTGAAGETCLLSGQRSHES
jgi:hypothetical protein